MKSGSLDRLLTLQRHVLARDAQNRPVSNWADLGTVAASWRRATSNERLASAQVDAQVTDLFEVRWTPSVEDLNAKDRLTFDGRVYDIVDVTETGRREGLLIRANARADL